MTEQHERGTGEPESSKRRAMRPGTLANQQAFREAELILRARARELDPLGEIVREHDCELIERFRRKLRRLERSVASVDTVRSNAAFRLARDTWGVLNALEIVLFDLEFDLELGDKDGAERVVRDMREVIRDELAPRARRKRTVKP